MINGVVVGIVIDNVDPHQIGRVKVNYPVDAATPPSSGWIRMLSPMAGKLRGLVAIPEVGTEVVIGFAYRTMSPYVLGAVYNGAADQPKTYANEDGNDDHRRFWSRNSHWIDFDDTAGTERIEIKATSENNAVYLELHSANKVITQKAAKDIINESVGSVSLKCVDFKVDASASVAMSAGTSAVFAADASAKVKGTTMLTLKATKVDINGGSPGKPTEILATPAHKHPPSKAGGG